MALIKVVLCPAVGVTGSIWSGGDERASAQSPPTVRELGVGGMIRVTGTISCVAGSGSTAVGACSCTELSAVLGEGIGGRDARLLSVGGW